MLDFAGGKIRVKCDGCGSTIWALDTAQTGQMKGFPVPVAALQPLIAQALKALEPDFAGCKILCVDCSVLCRIEPEDEE